MAKKTWTVENHEVALDWGYWGGRRVVSVDGEVVDESTVPLRWKSKQSFDLDGHSCVVSTKPSTKVSPFFVVDLEVDGAPVQPTSGRDAWESKKSPSS